MVGSAVAGRRHADLENIIGMFVNMLVMRNQPLEDLTFTEFLEQVKTNALDAYENQDYQLDELANRLGIEAQAGRNPLFDAQFTYQDAAEAVSSKSDITIPTLNIRYYSFKHRVQPFDLSLIASESNDRFSVKLGYLTALFERSTIENMAKHYREILEQCMENKDIKLKDIDISLDLVKATAELTGEDVSDFEF
jgi:non-ribosomal peptide synthetase component F